MPQLVQVPGLGDVEFPDELSESEIKYALDSHFAEQAPEAAPSVHHLIPAIPGGEVRPVSEVTGAIGKGVLGIANLPTRLANISRGVEGFPDVPGNIPYLEDLPRPHLPQVQPEELGPQQTALQTVAGIGNLLSRNYEGLIPGFAPPEVGLTLPLLSGGGLTAKLGTGLYGAAALGSVPQEVEAAREAIQEPSTPLMEKIAAGGQPAISTGFGALMMRHALEPTIPLPQTLKETARSLYASRLRENARQVQEAGVKPEGGPGQGRPDLEQPAPREPSGAAPQPEAAASSEGQPRVLLNPNDLVPALDVEGEPLVGAKGANHESILNANVIQHDNPAAVMKAFGEDSKHIFVDKNGKQYTRIEARDALGLNPKEYPKGLDSEALDKLQKVAPEPSLEVGAAAKRAAPETKTILDALAARAQEANTPNANAVRMMLRSQFGMKSGGPVRVIHAPESNSLGTIWWDKNGKPVGIQINAAKISGIQQLRDVLLHEVGHWADITAPKPVIDAITKGMTLAEKKEIISDVKRLKYEHGEWKKEFRADAVRIMAEKWAERNPTWWQNIVANVSRVANEMLGIKLTRLGAENAAARSIAIALEAIKSKGKQYAEALESASTMPESVAKDMPEVIRRRLLEQVQKEFRKSGFAEKKGEEEPTAPKPIEPAPAAPKAAVSIAAEEPPHGVRLDVTTPEQHPLGPIAATTPQSLAWHQILTGELKEAGTGLRRFWRSFSMQALPRMTEADRRTGELGVRLDASKRVARIKGLEFAANITDGIRTKGFDQQLGTALTEDNLRGIRKGFQDEAQKAATEGDTEKADAATEAANKVTTLVGAKNSPFQTEAQYQDFLKSPDAQKAIRKHIQLWNEQKDPIYRKANDLDPDLPLQSRGLQTGARVNLKAVVPGEGTQTTVGTAGRSPLIRQAVTRLRRDPFARQAKGTGASYEGSYQEILANGYEREFPVAAQHEFIKQMIDSGLAKVTVNREFPKGMLVRGEVPKAFELKIGPWRNQWLQVPRSLAEEYQNVSGLTPGWDVPVLKPLSNLLTQASVQGFAEGSTHVSNLSTGILTNLGPTANPMLNALIKSAGRSDVLYTLPRILIRGFTATRPEMLKLAEMGAAKTPYGGLLGWFINGIDRGVRLVSADVYDGMAKKGWVVDTETGKREFINQVGQYSKRLQPMIIARLRETGVQPFATAMHTFNVQGLRTLGMGPGAKAPTKLAALALRADKAAGLMGFIVLTAAINKIVSGNATGATGTPLGSIGWTGDDGKLRQFNLARLFGYERGPRATGLQAFVESRRLGLPEATAVGTAVRSVGQTGLGYVSGPATQFATKAITGKRPGIPMVQEAKVLPPPTTDELKPLKTQAAANIAIALQQANPAVDAALMAMQGKEVPDILQRQFSRYTPRTGMSQETIKAMPKIMAAKQMADYVDSIAKEARKQPMWGRMAFVQERFRQDELTPKQRQEALQRLKFKGTFRYR